ncbi:MAG: hypothetical protein JJU27_09330 [Gammaproteobacteria bacterium]|nr:hypothetical protein [Gammaproteobacteria bacterium]
MTATTTIARAAGWACAAALAGLPAVAGAESGGRQLYAEPSPLISLISRAAEMPEDARLDLAHLIIDAVAAAYESELDQILIEPQQRASDQRRVASWSRATAQLLAELRSAQADLLTAENLMLRTDPQGQILLLIDGRAVWASWPRLSAQTRLERQVAAQFCARHACPRDDDEEAPGLQVIDAAPRQGHWTLSQHNPPTWESEAGVRCEFADFSDRSSKEASCRSLVADLENLASALRTTMRRGTRIDWPSLSLRAEMSDGLHGFTVNPQGDYITVFVPALASHPIDWRETRRWLQAHLDDRHEPATIRRVQAPGG